MAEKWYDGLSDDAFKTETDMAYEKAEAKIRHGLAEGLDFDAACAGIEVLDETLKENIINDMLKVLIAEEHFGKKLELKELSAKYRLSPDRLEAAKLSMIEEVKNTAIKAFYKSLRPGNA